MSLGHTVHGAAPGLCSGHSGGHLVSAWSMVIMPPGWYVWSEAHDTCQDGDRATGLCLAGLMAQMGTAAQPECWRSCGVRVARVISCATPEGRWPLHGSGSGHTQVEHSSWPRQEEASCTGYPAAQPASGAGHSQPPADQPPGARQEADLLLEPEVTLPSATVS